MREITRSDFLLYFLMVIVSMCLKVAFSQPSTNSTTNSNSTIDYDEMNSTVTANSTESLNPSTENQDSSGMSETTLGILLFSCYFGFGFLYGCIGRWSVYKSAFEKEGCVAGDLQNNPCDWHLGDCCVEAPLHCCATTCCGPCLFGSHVQDCCKEKTCAFDVGKLQGGNGNRL